MPSINRKKNIKNDPPKLRIAIEARRLFAEHKRGMDVMALEMIRHLQQADTNNEYFILTRKGPDQCLAETPNFHIVELGGLGYAAWEQHSLAKWVNRHQPDLLHCTSGTAPLKISCPLIITIHDLLFLERRETRIIPLLQNIYRRWVTPRAAQLAKLVVAVSRYQKEEIKARLLLPDEKVTVMYNGIPQRFYEQAPSEMKLKVNERYCLPDRYMLLVATTDPRKNLRGVLRAYTLLHDYLGNDLPHLVVGGLSPKQLEDEVKRLQQDEIKSKVIATGYINSEHLPIVYQQAELLIFPSYSEGFGLPIIEAMASGIPVITSDVTSMPEVAEDAALLVSPASPPSIARAMELLLTTTMLRSIIVQKASARLKHFYWPDKVQELLQHYLHVASNEASHEPNQDATNVEKAPSERTF